MKDPLTLLVEKRQEMYFEYVRFKEVFCWNIDDEFVKCTDQDLQKIKELIDKYDAAIALLK